MEEDESLWHIFKQALKHFWDSKTNFWMWWASLLGFIAFLIIIIIYGDVLLEELLMFLGFNGGGAVVRAVGVDGLPKVAASWKNPDSLAANPPPAVSNPIPNGIVPAQVNPIAPKVNLNPGSPPPFRIS